MKSEINYNIVVAELKKNISPLRFTINYDEVRSTKDKNKFLSYIIVSFIRFPIGYSVNCTYEKIREALDKKEITLGKGRNALEKATAEYVYKKFVIHWVRLINGNPSSILEVLKKGEI